MKNFATILFIGFGLMMSDIVRFSFKSLMIAASFSFGVVDYGGIVFS